MCMCVCVCTRAHVYVCVVSTYHDVVFVQNEIEDFSEDIASSPLQLSPASAQLELDLVVVIVFVCSRF